MWYTIFVRLYVCSTKIYACFFAFSFHLYLCSCVSIHQHSVSELDSYMLLSMRCVRLCNYIHISRSVVVVVFYRPSLSSNYQCGNPVNYISIYWFILFDELLKKMNAYVRIGVDGVVNTSKWFLLPSCVAYGALFKTAFSSILPSTASTHSECIHLSSQPYKFNALALQISSIPIHYTNWH